MFFRLVGFSGLLVLLVAWSLAGWLVALLASWLVCLLVKCDFAAGLLVCCWLALVCFCFTQGLTRLCFVD